MKAHNYLTLTFIAFLTTCTFVDVRGDHASLDQFTISLTATNLPAQYALHTLMTDWNTRYPSNAISICLVQRDVRSTPKPNNRQICDASLGKPLVDHQEYVTLNLHDSPLLIVASTLADLIGSSAKITQLPNGKIKLTIFPDELSGNHKMTRNIYRVPEHLHDLFNQFPTNLSNSGASTAYNPDTRILTIIENTSVGSGRYVAKYLGLEWLNDDPEM